LHRKKCVSYRALVTKEIYQKSVAVEDAKCPPYANKAGECVVLSSKNEAGVSWETTPSESGPMSAGVPSRGKKGSGGGSSSRKSDQGERGKGPKEIPTKRK